MGDARWFEVCVFAVLGCGVRQVFLLLVWMVMLGGTLLMQKYGLVSRSFKVVNASSPNHFLMLSGLRMLFMVSKFESFSVRVCI